MSMHMIKIWYIRPSFICENRLDIFRSRELFSSSSIYFVNPVGTIWRALKIHSRTSKKRGSPVLIRDATVFAQAGSGRPPSRATLFSPSMPAVKTVCRFPLKRYYNNFCDSISCPGFQHVKWRSYFIFMHTYWCVYIYMWLILPLYHLTMHVNVIEW